MLPPSPSSAPPTFGAPPAFGAPAAPAAAAGAEVVPGPPERSRSKLVLIGGLVAILAVVAAGVFAVRQFTGGEEGGAASPEELGTELIAAIEAEDALGVVDLLLPGERDALRDPLVELVEDLARLEVLDAGTTLSDIGGIDLQIDDPEVDVDGTNVADISNVTLLGTITAVVDGEALPIGDLIRDGLGEDVDLGELDTTDTTDLVLPFTAVEDDGRWYLSFGFTIAEVARRGSIEAPDIPEAGVAAVGGDTPEDALDELLGAVGALDLARLVGALNPGEAAALQRYAPLFLDDAQAAFDEVPLEWQITEAEYTVEGGGGRRHATVDLLVIEGVADGEAFTAELEGSCAKVTVPGQDLVIDSCELADEQAEMTEEFFAEAPTLEELVSTLEEAFADVDASTTGITLVETDGEWYVSPVGSVLDALLAVTGALDRAELDRIIELVPAAFEEVGTALGGDIAFEQEFTPIDEEDLDEDAVPTTAPTDDTDDTITDDTITDDTVTDDTAFDESPASECYAASSGTEASDCFLELLAAGEVEEWEVPAELRFPECGVADLYWTGYSTLGDAEFFDAVEPARPCFQERLAAGEVDEFELPYWVEHLDCFEGRNWYGTFGDDEYDSRFFDCVSS